MARIHLASSRNVPWEVDVASTRGSVEPVSYVLVEMDSDSVHTGELERVFCCIQAKEYNPLHHCRPASEWTDLCSDSAGRIGVGRVRCPKDAAFPVNVRALWAS